MFGRRTREEISKLTLEIEKLKVQLGALENNVRSTRGLVNRKLRNTTDEEEYEGAENPEQMDAATMQRNLLGFK